jgi:hypothetical protein
VILLSRKDRGPDPFLHWKVQILLGAGLLAFLGIGLESSILVGLAIMLLLLGVGLRFIGRSHRKEETDGEMEERDES